jgi:sulfite exporter TauE/SafE
MSLLFAVLGASFLGSVHCAAMCGGFVCLYSGGGSTRAAHATSSRARRAAPHTAYNAGRLVSYLSLGALAGLMGRGVNGLGRVAGYERLAAVAAGALMVVWGGSTLLAALGVRMSGGAPRSLQAALTSLLVRFRNQSPTARGVATGLLTTLLPCGWLYVFVATAGGTGRMPDAIAVMFFFWLGTLPMMATVGLGAQRMFGTFQRRLPLVAAGAAVALGLLTMAGRMSARPVTHAGHVEMVHDGR